MRPFQKDDTKKEIHDGCADVNAKNVPDPCQPGAEPTSEGVFVWLRSCSAEPSTELTAEEPHTEFTAEEQKRKLKLASEQKLATFTIEE